MISLVLLVLFVDLDDEIFAILWSLVVWGCDYVLPLVAVAYIFYCGYLVELPRYIWDKIRRVFKLGLRLLGGLAGFARNMPHG
jgi:hypothetical protein